MESTAPPICRRLAVLAERDPRRAVPLVRRALISLKDETPAIKAWMCYTLGWALLCWERFDEARLHLHDAHAMFKAVGAQRAMLRCQHALLIANLAQLARPDLEQDFIALAEAFVQANDPIEATRVRIDQARLLYALNRPYDATDLLTQIEPLIVQTTPLDHARFLRIRGAVANLHGDGAQALDLLTQAEHAFVALHNRCEVAKCWLERGWVALRQEQLDLALADYQQAERVLIQLNLPLQQAFCAKNIGLLMTRRGAYDLALQSTLAALTTFRELGRISDTGACQLHIGNIYFYTGQWEAALASYTRAETIYVDLGLVGYSLVARRNKVMVYHAQRRYAEAQTLLVRVETLARESDNRPELAEVWRQKAELFADTEQTDQAIIYYQQARALFEQVGNKLGVTDSTLEQGWLALKRGAVDEARALFESIILLVARHPYNLWRVEYGLARCAEHANEFDKALNHYQSATAVVADLRRRLASEAISSSLYIQAAQLHQDALRLAIEHAPVATVLEMAEGQRALVLRQLLTTQSLPFPEQYRAEHDALRETISTWVGEEPIGDSEHASALDAALAAYSDLLLRARHSLPSSLASFENIESTFDLAALRVRLGAAYGADWTALSYILQGDRLLICILTPDGLALDQTPYDVQFQLDIAQATQQAYRRYTYLDLPYLQEETNQPWENLRTLANRLVPQSLHTRLNAEHRLLIVPAGPLHAVPWAALRIKDAWLAERAVLQILPSLATCFILLGRRPSSTGAALLVGCSEFGARAPSLPAVGAELTAVAARWPGDCYQLRDMHATRSALQALSAQGTLAEYRLLHIASHARLMPSRGLMAHLKLWDGDLLLPEIAGLRLKSALVALSACDGAAADALSGEEVLNLSWAFLAAGASSVLASLWHVDDAIVPVIMAAFYDEMRRHGDAALALALAQRSLINAYQSENDSSIEPHCWGSFVLLGIGHLA